MWQLGKRDWPERLDEMDAYVYQAALLCADCGEQEALDKFGMTPADANIGEEYTSDECPQGPYPDGGGEADSPQHCDTCHVFLQNPLTGDGHGYVLTALGVALRGDGDLEVVNNWIRFYARRRA